MCPAPSSFSSSPSSVKVLLGVFCTLKDVSLRRAVRETWAKTADPTVFDIVFVVASDSPVSLDDEKDLFVVPMHENMNEGKSIQYFAEAATKKQFDFVCKVDIDTIPNLSELKYEAQKHWPRTRAYVGKPLTFFHCGAQAVCPRDHSYMAGQFYCVSADVAKWIEQQDRSKDISGSYEDVTFGNWMFKTPFALSHVSYFKNDMVWKHEFKGEEKLKRGILFRKRLEAIEAMYIDPSRKRVENVTINGRKRKKKQATEKVILLSLDCQQASPFKRNDPLFKPFKYDSLSNKLAWTCRHGYKLIVQGCNMMLPRRP